MTTLQIYVITVVVLGTGKTSPTHSSQYDNFLL